MVKGDQIGSQIGTAFSSPTVDRKVLSAVKTSVFRLPMNPSSDPSASRPPLSDSGVSRTQDAVADESPKGCLTYNQPRAANETPSGIECGDPELLRLAYAAIEALDDDRLDEGKQRIDQLIEAYPNCLWGYELYDRYLIWSRDLYMPENRIDVDFFLKESIRNLERMLVLNPEDERTVYFAWSQYDCHPLHLLLALHHCDAAWEARSEQDAQVALAECRRHLSVWTADEQNTFPAQCVRVSQAERIEALCAGTLAAWTKTGGRLPDAEEKIAAVNEAIDEGSLSLLNRELRWPWKAGLEPDTTLKGDVCKDTARLRLAHAAMESLAAGRRRRGKRLVDTLIAAYPDCIWGYELYQVVLESESDRSYASLKEQVHNLERMQSLSPDESAVYFEADICLSESLLRCACDAAWAAPTEQEARGMQAVCLRQIEKQLLDFRAPGQPLHQEADARKDEDMSEAEEECRLIADKCAAVMKAWAEAGGGVPSHDDKSRLCERKREASAIPARVVELLDDDFAMVDMGGVRKEVMLLVDDVAVGDYVGISRGCQAITKLDPEKAKETQ